MSEDIKVVKCVKIEEEEAKKLDPAKMGLMIMDAPQAGEVEGQHAWLFRAQCPGCGHFGWSPPGPEWLRCGNCGVAFKVSF